MPNYLYVCENCSRHFELYKPVAELDKPELCLICSAIMTRKICTPALIGTRDGFGVGRGFYDAKTGKYIDNFKTWEKAGFKEPGDVGGKNSEFIKNRVKELKKHKTYQTKSKALEFAERI